MGADIVTDLAARRAESPAFPTGAGVFDAFAVDLDGTLLDSRQQVSDRDARALQALRDAGVRVVVCTGRHYRALLAFDRVFDFERDLFIVDGGCTVLRFEQGQVVSNMKLLDPADRRTLVRIAEGHGFWPTVFMGGYVASMPHDNPWHRVFEGIIDDMPVVYDSKLDGQLERLNVGKMVLITDPALLPELDAQIAEAGVSAEVGQSLPYAVDVCARGKGEALRGLIADLGIGRVRLAAIGDSGIDVSMLQAAGFGVAVGNASPELKAQADLVVADNDHCGVAEAVRACFGLDV